MGSTAAQQSGSASPSSSGRRISVLVVTENASLRTGGEASLGYYFFKCYMALGVDAHLLVHERSRDELIEAFDRDVVERMHFVRDTRTQRAIFKIGSRLPQRLVEILIDTPLNVSTQRRQRRLARQLIPTHGLGVVHQVAPIAPRFPSLMYDLGVPVAMGPLCGGMDFPAAFRNREGRAARLLMPIARALTGIYGLIAPGRRKADALVFAHCNTQRALPRRTKGRQYELVESGVDLSIWKQKSELGRPLDQPTRFIFLGQVRAWKGVDLLVQAFAARAVEMHATLDVVGDGELREPLQSLVAQLGLSDRVTFHGWKPRVEAADIMRRSDVLVLPSLRECGGTALLEAMAVGLPVIAARWGGPTKYVLDGETGVLVEPTSEARFVVDLGEAMVALSNNEPLRRRMAERAVVHVRSHAFDWDNKADAMLRILEEIVQRTPSDG
jgi:glycosyltransferase involved in cell wall biosynthesis